MIIIPVFILFTSFKLHANPKKKKKKKLKKKRRSCYQTKKFINGPKFANSTILAI